jgi:hypothetical protein
MATAEMEIEVSVAEELLRKYRHVRVSIERIGPEEAREYLKSNTKNRKLNDNHARRLREVMMAGDWWLNGETIVFGADGTLLNGQHRLTAIVQAGVFVDVLVVRGVDEEAFRTIDAGRTRTTGEVLGIDGEKNANCVAAAVQALLTFVDTGGSIQGTTFRGRKATPMLVARVLMEYPQIRDSVNAMKRNSLFRNQHSVVLHLLFLMVSPRVAEEFACVMADGHPDIGRPFVVFRESLVRQPMRSDLRRAYSAKAIKAFNAEISGERPKMFKFSDGEEFPTIAGLDYEKLAESIG